MANLIPAIDISSSGLQAERTRLEIVASNITNAQTTRGPDGLPYRRKEVIFAPVLDQAQAAGNKATGVKIGKIVDDPTPFQNIYMPGHPHADAKGFVKMPNVNIVDEMVDMMTSSRAYEANLEVIKNARQMVTQAMQIAEA
ncbi:flagellar basal-body rod protein FlgC [Verrucomicrobium sp. GAS474]|uniref:flagellar basal body rod protein FlgC n=1 Tax=Verrucomicrobium sp. GAS474 TaxID=1882831 RepID=UPI000879B557|nr:flagellar basal body rod protein FlgC [Verrucomicrobium sp. GAS474]SDU25168.1 flagellar basal-body rod protein FlgC [Verrucomicrobium sp. GAS474]